MMQEAEEDAHREAVSKSIVEAAVEKALLQVKLSVGCDMSRVPHLHALMCTFDNTA